MTFLKSLFTKLTYGAFTDRPDYYTIQKHPITGKWAIYDEDGHAVNTYTRRRDAFRGAERNGYTLV